MCKNVSPKTFIDNLSPITLSNEFGKALDKIGSDRQNWMRKFTLFSVMIFSTISSLGFLRIDQQTSYAFAHIINYISEVLIVIKLL